jgi:hypothetical protein
MRFLDAKRKNYTSPVAELPSTSAAHGYGSLVLIGPIAIMTGQSTEDYEEAINRLIMCIKSTFGKCPEVMKTHSKWQGTFVTDDEPALYNAILRQLPEWRHLLCNVHLTDTVKRNLKAFLKKIGQPESGGAPIVSDILGHFKGNTYFDGLQVTISIFTYDL